MDKDWSTFQNNDETATIGLSRPEEAKRGETLLELMYLNCA